MAKKNKNDDKDITVSPSDEKNVLEWLATKGAEFGREIIERIPQAARSALFASLLIFATTAGLFAQGQDKEVVQDPTVKAKVNQMVDDFVSTCIGDHAQKHRKEAAYEAADEYMKSASFTLSPYQDLSRDDIAKKIFLGEIDAPRNAAIGIDSSIDARAAGKHKACIARSIRSTLNGNFKILEQRDKNGTTITVYTDDLSQK